MFNRHQSGLAGLVPGWILQDIALDHRWDNGVVVAQSDQRRHDLIEAGQLAETLTVSDALRAGGRSRPSSRIGAGPVLRRGWGGYAAMSMAIVPPTSSEHPATWKFGYPIYHAETRAQWRSWLAANHESGPGMWLCSWRSSTGRPRCPYPEVVEEAICFGWIDSTVNVLDDDRDLQLLTPRKAKSSWTRLNRQRFSDMEAAGSMTDAGRRAADVARGNGWWTIYDPVEDLIKPDELSMALDENAKARMAWDGFPPSARKMMLWWVVSAAREDTRANRIATIVDKASRGERAQG